MSASFSTQRNSESENDITLCREQVTWNGSLATIEGKEGERAMHYRPLSEE